MTALDFLRQFPLPSRERAGPASATEMRRWFDGGGVWFNAELTGWREPIDFPVASLVLFPRGRRVTLW